MSQGPLCSNLSQKVQKEVSQLANRNLSPVILLGGLSVNLNHLKTSKCLNLNGGGYSGVTKLKVPSPDQIFISGGGRGRGSGPNPRIG